MRAVIDILREWQDLASGVLAFLAGILGFLAAICAVYMTLRSERRRDERELFAIKRALTAEIFQFATMAFAAHRELKRLSEQGFAAGLMLHDVEEATRFVDPVIYPNAAARLGLLGDHANDIVLFFSQVQTIRAAVARMRRDLMDRRLAAEKALETMRSESGSGPIIKTPIPVAIGLDNSNDLCEKLLITTEIASELLPNLSTGSIDDEPIFNFRKAVGEARAAWGQNRFG